MKALLRGWKVRSLDLLPDKVRMISLLFRRWIACIGLPLPLIVSFFEDCYNLIQDSGLKRKTVVLLDRMLPELETKFGNVFGRISLVTLKQYPTPEKLVRAQTRKLKAVL